MKQVYIYIYINKKILNKSIPSWYDEINVDNIDEINIKDLRDDKRKLLTNICAHEYQRPYIYDQKNKIAFGLHTIKNSDDYDKQSEFGNLILDQNCSVYENKIIDVCDEKNIKKIPDQKIENLNLKKQWLNEFVKKGKWWIEKNTKCIYEERNKLIEQLRNQKLKEKAINDVMNKFIQKIRIKKYDILKKIFIWANDNGYDGLDEYIIKNYLPSTTSHKNILVYERLVAIANEFLIILENWKNALFEEYKWDSRPIVQNFLFTKWLITKDKNAISIWQICYMFQKLYDSFKQRIEQEERKYEEELWKKLNFQYSAGSNFINLYWNDKACDNIKISLFYKEHKLGTNIKQYLNLGYGIYKVKINLSNSVHNDVSIEVRHPSAPRQIGG